MARKRKTGALTSVLAMTVVFPKVLCICSVATSNNVPTAADRWFPANAPTMTGRAQCDFRLSVVVLSSRTPVASTSKYSPSSTGGVLKGHWDCIDELLNPFRGHPPDKCADQTELPPGVMPPQIAGCSPSAQSCRQTCAR